MADQIKVGDTVKFKQENGIDDKFTVRELVGTTATIVDQHGLEWIASTLDLEKAG